jgi:hypothetical protein
LTEPLGNQPAQPAPRLQERAAEREPCDQCGFTSLHWVKCKLICANCGQINKSCADL